MTGNRRGNDEEWRDKNGRDGAWKGEEKWGGRKQGKVSAPSREILATPLYAYAYGIVNR